MILGFASLLARALGLLESEKASSSSDMATMLNAEVTNTCDCLHRLHKLRLVDRQPVYTGKKGRARYNYRISPRGVARVRYFKRQKTIAHALLAS
jgi:predicted transcriptional regulator